MWNGWPITRVILLFTGLALLMISLQVTIFHYRQNFRHWAMYGPVVGGPVIGILSIALSLYNLPQLRNLLAILFFLGILLGVVGSALHFSGIGQRVGGYGESQNFLVGPPLTLPIMVAAMSILGLIALYWR
ncbi:conserved hypothetical protein [Desulfofarcimen acetoxidans DSM 771]|jgi:hypothetical protein|uniref:Uncharacterized protein n=1 Tax=Desulfofarcimen acetoxidans (strain ATCC 49208 / DSM 771 / KCTC 5769 / VKM B-1644 / 5575) TaxID=485916 RepID=C8VXV1_DESAS|nr:hypothetical protein [Desulfofarcimen acetoxidans]ACV62757.1 conserved hypothetical protein [Desulfofarcimen acetoxidans DSM 771]